ncbi:MAG: hypothetical protein IJY90_00690 [Clostridia bacterium]|nr:hypothetical protein [Clostridia bacterium]
MFIKKKLTSKKESEKQFEFDIFKMEQNNKDDDQLLKIGQAKVSYNFISQDGSLRSGYGFKEFTSPISEENLDDEHEFAVRGNEVSKIWKLKWYDKNSDRDCNYLFYYNDENYVCFDNIFKPRTSPFFVQTNFTSLPYITNYRYDKQDAILLSGKDGNTMVISGAGWTKESEAQGIISCCDHYGKLFAITASARGTLVYTDSDFINWDDTHTSDLDFTDERGDLNKIISFNDYLYIFRDFGITQVSVYSNNETFAISHMYKASEYIQPNTIVEFGDNIYFMEGDKLKVFNGSSVKDVPIKCLDLIKGQDARYMSAECFDGKYFLACRANFDDGEKIGCENSESGFKNNLLLVYDIENKQVDLLRGVDVRQMLALTNNLKSKLVVCFYNDNKGKIGQLVKNGSVFGQRYANLWKSGKLDFDMPGQRKRIKSFLIYSLSDCKVTLTSEEGEKNFFVKGGSEVQKISANLAGNTFGIEIAGLGEDDDYISNFVVTVSK